MVIWEKIKKVFSCLKKEIFDILFPVECIGCAKEGEWLCRECLKKIRTDGHSLSGESLDRILTFYSYDNEILKRAIHLLKYKFVESLALPLGDLVAEGICEKGRPPGKEFILIPVPLSRKRFLERGFNQAEIIAEKVSRRFGWPLEAGVLKRIRATPSQVDLEEGERRKNVKGAFSVSDISKIANKKIILMDDVLTTGATMEECARTLKLGGAKEVWGIALAKG